MRLRKWAIALLCGSMTVSAQESDEQFTIATLNVDGLPQKILVVKLNADGPGDAGTARIGKYLKQKNYDLVMMQEDFNYHDVLSVFLEDDYNFDEWSGTVGIEDQNIDFLHLQNHRFACDGLMACWKKDLTVTPLGRTAWKQSFGKFSHANDDLITKGFRRYDVTLRDGTQIMVYNMHMDASLDEDEAEGLDTKDKEARMAQWKQLKEDIMEHARGPVIIVGDMNSFYGYDDVKREFIDALSEIAEVDDVWVKLHQNGVYPDDRDKGIKNGETLDKIIYINMLTTGNGVTRIQPVDYQVDREGYQYNGQPLGDHYPVSATFRVEHVKTGIDTMQKDEKQERQVYNLNGQRINESQHGIVIERQGEKTVKHIIK